MDLQAIIEKYLSRLPEGIASKIFNSIKDIPFIQKEIQKEIDKMMSEMEGSLKPYKGKVESFPKIPEEALDRKKILSLMEALKQKEMPQWKDGYVSGAVYHGDDTHINFLNKVYGLNSQSNPLHSDIWPSASKYEAEIISMTANMLGGGRAKDEVCGSVSSGGTESILLAMKTYRDWARETKRSASPRWLFPSRPMRHLTRRPSILTSG